MVLHLVRDRGPGYSVYSRRLEGSNFLTFVFGQARAWGQKSSFDARLVFKPLKISPLFPFVK